VFEYLGPGVHNLVSTFPELLVVGAITNIMRTVFKYLAKYFENSNI